MKCITANLGDAAWIRTGKCERMNVLGDFELLEP
jgi:hypothetical protein